MADTWTMLSGYTASNYVDTMVFEVVSATKKITPLSGQTLVAGEKNSQYVRFEMDRFWDGIDISAKNFSITYSLAGKYYGTSEAVSAEVSTDKLRFGWIVPEEACCIAGTLMFVLVIKSDGYALKTQIAETPVVKSLDEESVVPEPTREAWYKEFQARVQEDLDASQAALTSAQDALTRANTANDAATEANLAAQDAIVVAKERYGSPLVANAGPEMVETNRVYVFTGSESAYTYGHWYYYDNGVWNDGGVYNGNGVNTDKTLSIENMPADAKKTGDEISELKEDLNALPQSLGTLDEDADLYLSDENGNALVAFAEGHVKTKNFDSEDISERVASLEEEGEQSYIPDIMETDASDADLDITDSHGNVVARFAQGHIKTKNFDSNEALERISDAENDITDANKEITFIKRVRTRMCFGAHNGAEYYAPECTIPAYRIAGQQGWEWAWIAGISFSSEGSMYVLHDSTVDRTTDGTGSLSSMTDAQIDALNITQTGAGYDLADFDPAELKIPTLEQVVQQCVKYGMKMVIRLSDFPNGTDTAENKAKWDNFLEVLNGYGVQPEDISCYLDSGSKAITCRTLIGDDVEISTHLGQSATASDFVDWFESRSITGRKAAILSYQNTNLEAVKLLHSHGIRVYSYGYNSQAQADNCALWGVDIYQNGRIYKITG